MGQWVCPDGLSILEQNAIRQLETVCCEREPLHLKLNWDMLVIRNAAEKNDFLYYEDGLLVGFLGLYPLESLEMTGMVHPDYRRRGIFQQLFATAYRECALRGYGKMLLITERASRTGGAFVRQTGARYVYTEYRMQFAAQGFPDYPKLGIALRQATQDDLEALIQLEMECFTSSRESAQSYLSQHLQSMHVAEKSGEIIGQIGVVKDGEADYWH